MLLEVWKEPAVGRGAGGGSSAIRTPDAPPSREHRPLAAASLSLLPTAGPRLAGGRGGVT